MRATCRVGETAVERRGGRSRGDFGGHLLPNRLRGRISRRGRADHGRVRRDGRDGPAEPTGPAGHGWFGLGCDRGRSAWVDRGWRLHAYSWSLLSQTCSNQGRRTPRSELVPASRSACPGARPEGRRRLRRRAVHPARRREASQARCDLTERSRIAVERARYGTRCLRPFGACAQERPVPRARRRRPYIGGSSSASTALLAPALLPSTRVTDGCCRGSPRSRPMTSGQASTPSPRQVDASTSQGGSTPLPAFHARERQPLTDQAGCSHEP